METVKAKLIFTEPVLGTLAGEKEVAKEFIASKHPQGEQADEVEVIENIEETLEKSSTIFPRDENGNPFVWDYQIKGFFKDACLAMISTGTLTQEALKKVGLTKYMHKRTIDQLVFPKPRKILFQLPDGIDPAKLEFCERPLRAQTMKGERIALARSEMIPAGTIIEFEVLLLNKNLEDFIKQWLTYGQLRGLGQWRNSGMGRFDWSELQ